MHWLQAPLLTDGLVTFSHPYLRPEVIDDNLRAKKLVLSVLQFTTPHTYKRSITASPEAEHWPMKLSALRPKTLLFSVRTTTAGSP